MNAESGFSPSRKTFREFFSYILVGALTNFLGYALYLLLTYLWGAPKLTMTLLYFVAASIGFFANRKFTFRHNGHITTAVVRYLQVQLAGYLINLVLLLLLVDWLGLAHQLAQAIAIIVVAIFLFVLLRVFVFAPSLTVTGVVRQ